MYTKLLFRNAVRSIKDYLIYIVTLTLCVSMFYAAMSITSSFYKPDIGAEFDITILGDALKITITVITFLMLFLISYVNKYMIERRKREFAIQTIMGMERGTTAGIFFIETLCMGIVSLAVGILLGVLLSQFITALLMSSYGREYHVAWTLFPDTVVICVLFFMICFFLIGIINVKEIRRIPITQMLSAVRENDGSIRKSRFMPIILVLYLISAADMIEVSIVRIMPYYDSRHPIVVKAMIFGVILSPLVSILAAIIFCLWELIKRRKLFRLHRLVLILLATMPIVIISVALVPIVKMRYYFPVGQDTLNMYLIQLIIQIIYFISAAVYLTSFFFTHLKEKITHKYKEENLFFYGQILSKLKTTVKSMTLIGLTLALSIGMFIVEPVLTGWALGFLKMRAAFDVQIVSRYNDIENIEDIPRHDYKEVGDFLRDNNVEILQDCLVTSYLPLTQDFHHRNKYEFPATAISLSDYNTLRSMRDEELVSLREREFLTQWRVLVDYESAQEYAQEHSIIETDAGRLTLAENGIYYAGLGEMLYNSYNDVIYVFPDSVCEKLLGVSSDRFIRTKEPIAYDVAVALDKFFSEEYPITEESRCYIRMKSQQINETTASMFTLKLGMIYAAVILMLSCITILALQQLSEADRFGFRFGVLRRLGVEQPRIDKLIVKQIAFWLGLPVVLAVVGAGIFECYICTAFWSEINVYIGAGALGTQLCAISVILAALLICYFVTTWLLFKRSIVGAAATRQRS